MSSIKRELHEFVSAHCLRAAHGPLSDETLLLATGILDSVNIFELIIFIEKTYGITVQIEDASRTNFATLNTIETFVRQRHDADAIP